MLSIRTYGDFRFRVLALLLLAVIALAISPALTASAQAQGRAQLTGRAILSASYVADGPTSGTKLSASAATINGVRVPFNGQPVGAIADILPGDWAGTWLALVSGQFNASQNSADFLLRMYVFDLNMKRASSGTGETEPLDKWNLSDPDRKISTPIVNNDSRERYLTGADFAPRAFKKVPSDGSFWIAEEKGPSLLHFDGYGKLLEPPIGIDGGGLQGMAITPDGGALVVAQEGSGGVIFRRFDLTTRTFTEIPGVYPLVKSGNNVGGIVLINPTKMLVLEIDDLQNTKAQFKQVFLIDISQGNFQKILMADLLNIDDSSNISTASVFPRVANPVGLGATFKMPYRTITAMYPSDEQSLVVVNNNRVPFGLGRSASQADPSDFIVLRLPQSLDLDSAFRRPAR